MSKFILEYYIDMKYIGKTVTSEVPDRPIGYAGKESRVAIIDILIGKRKIKKGQQYETIYYPMNEGVII